MRKGEVALADVEVVVGAGIPEDVLRNLGKVVIVGSTLGSTSPSIEDVPIRSVEPVPEK